MRAPGNLSRPWALLPLAFFAAFAFPAQANVFISAKPTSNMSCSGGVCTPTAHPANLNATELAHMLASSDVTVESGSDTFRREIIVSASFGWASTHRLTLDAHYATIIDAPVVVSGPGGLTITMPESLDDLSFGPNGRVIFRDLASQFVLDGKPAVLVGDIDSLASAVAAQPAGIFALARDVKPTAVYSTSPIPTTVKGQFEGLGNRIFYLRINDTAPNQHDGLFATVGFMGLVRNLGLVKAKVAGTSGSVIGTIAGENDGFVVRSYSTGMVLHTGSGGSLGGLVGWNNRGDITNSYSEASVHGQDNVSAGGLVGTENTGGVDYVRASGDVTGGKNASVGGLIGTSTGAIYYAQAGGAVTAGSGSFAGGLVGQGHDVITDSFATGAVSVGNLGKAGGLEGRFVNDGAYREVYASYATGSVTGLNAELGSLFGECCFSTADGGVQVYGTGAVSGAPHATIGGVVGTEDQPPPRWTAAYWNTDTTGVNNPGQGAGNVANAAGLAGLSDAQLKSALPAGFKPSEWGQSAGINNGYPYLLDNPPQ